MQPGAPQQPSRPLRIAIDCRSPLARQGHGATLRSLAQVLSQSQNPSQSYTFLVSHEVSAMLAPFLSGPCRAVTMPEPGSSGWQGILRSFPPARALAKRLPRPIPPVPGSDGYVEREQFDVVHFLTQDAYLTPIPSIYQPWDLQHVHYPQFFSARDLAIRNRNYPAFCEQAAAVCVQAEWTRQDLLRTYDLPPEDVVVIPWGSTFTGNPPPAPEAVEAVRAEFGLPARFFFYPAVTWPHKNHAVLLRALALLRQRHGRTVALYFTGQQTAFHATLVAMARDLGVAAQVHWLGFVTTEKLQALFATATAMLFPSLFEGFGMPILESFHSRLPVVASNATVLPEVAQEAALFFDPESEEQLAAHMLRLLDDPALRLERIAAGTEVLSRFDMRTTARAFQALYARVARP